MRSMRAQRPRRCRWVGVALRRLALGLPEGRVMDTLDGVTDRQKPEGWPGMYCDWPSLQRVGPRATIPHHIRVGLYQRDGRCCQLCWERWGDMHIDHVVPWSAGGSDCSTNLRILCAPCNMERRVRAVDTDLRAIEPLLGWCVQCGDPMGDPSTPDVMGLCVECGACEYGPTRAVDACPERLWGKCGCMRNG